MQIRQTSGKTRLRQIEALYEKAFPKCERKPFSLICEKQTLGCVDILSLEEDGSFCGLAITMKDHDRVLLDYFAIAAEHRGMGYGSSALREIFDFYTGKRLFLEIESTKEAAGNSAQRLRRKEFYLKNQMTELGIEANVFGTDMELLGHGISLTAKEYLAVYEAVYGRDMAKNVQISTFRI